MTMSKIDLIGLNGEDGSENLLEPYCYGEFGLHYCPVCPYRRPCKAVSATSITFSEECTDAA